VNYFAILSRNVSGLTEEYHERPQSRRPVRIRTSLLPDANERHTAVITHYVGGV